MPVGRSKRSGMTRQGVNTRLHVAFSRVARRTGCKYAIFSCVTSAHIQAPEMAPIKPSATRPAVEKSTTRASALGGSAPPDLAALQQPFKVHGVREQFYVRHRASFAGVPDESRRPLDRNHVQSACRASFFSDRGLRGIVNQARTEEDDLP